MDIRTGKWAAAPDRKTEPVRVFVSACDWLVRDAIAWRLSRLIPDADVRASAWSGKDDADYDGYVGEILLQGATPVTQGLSARLFLAGAATTTNPAPFGVTVIGQWQGAPDRLDRAVSDVLTRVLNYKPSQLGQSDSPDSAPQRQSLTPRQEEVLSLLARGLSNAAIAAELRMSENTVRIHVSAILRALGMTNRTQAALWAMKTRNS